MIEHLHVTIAYGVHQPSEATVCQSFQIRWTLISGALEHVGNAAYVIHLITTAAVEPVGLGNSLGRAIIAADLLSAVLHLLLHLINRRFIGDLAALLFDDLAARLEAALNELLLLAKLLKLLDDLVTSLLLTLQGTIFAFAWLAREWLKVPASNVGGDLVVVLIRELSERLLDDILDLDCDVIQVAVEALNSDVVHVYSFEVALEDLKVVLRNGLLEATVVIVRGELADILEAHVLDGEAE